MSEKNLTELIKNYEKEYSLLEKIVVHLNSKNIKLTLGSKNNGTLNFLFYI